jgi:CheY-like chemotaxis protein/anti-sigma regulatory factor (Ser/Thr protein kinase)
MQVIKAGKRAQELVSQILTFSRQREQQELQPVHIHLLVGEALQLLQASLPTTIEIKKQVDKNCGTVLADPSQLHQIIMNHCTNAHHAMQEQQYGILEVRLEKKEVAAGAAEETGASGKGNYIILTVKDTGCGMDEETMGHVFEPYFTTKGADKGSGLGLAVVHGIVKGLGGSISIESTLGQGTTFTVSLPSIAAATCQPEAVEPQAPLGKNERILVVEDDENVAELATLQLRNNGYQVTVTAGSRQALAEFRDHPDQYDLVLTDNIMPQMTGAELAGKLLAIRPDLPIILCSGASELWPAEKLTDLGIRSFLKKPFARGQLLHEVRKVLDGEQRGEV